MSILPQLPERRAAAALLGTQLILIALYTIYVKWTLLSAVNSLDYLGWGWGSWWWGWGCRLRFPERKRM